MNPLYSLTYLTRKCPRACRYCALRDATDVGRELTVKEWIDVFDRLWQLGVEFNLVLGNETWLLGEGLIELFGKNKIPFALYTTAPPILFDKYKEKIFNSRVIDNLSAGVDWPSSAEKYDDDSYRKSMDGLRALKWVRKKHPWVDTQATMTIHAHNFRYLPDYLKETSSVGIFTGVNYIHWNKDGKYDFFPNKDEIKDLLFTTRKKIDELKQVLSEVAEVAKGALLQNPEYLNVDDAERYVNMEWHCKETPYGGVTVDADGRLRVCGYRKGRFTPRFTAFDLPHRWDDIREAMVKDAKECPGCSWSYPWVYWKYAESDPDFGKKVFVSHAHKNIPQEKWSRRIINERRK